MNGIWIVYRFRGLVSVFSTVWTVTGCVSMSLRSVISGSRLVQRVYYWFNCIKIINRYQSTMNDSNLMRICPCRTIVGLNCARPRLTRLGNSAGSPMWGRLPLPDPQLPRPSCRPTVGHMHGRHKGRMFPVTGMVKALYTASRLRSVCTYQPCSRGQLNLVTLRSSLRYPTPLQPRLNHTMASSSDPVVEALGKYTT
jgi:hypothetical protein